MSEDISMAEVAEGEFHLTPSAQAILAYLEERWTETGAQLANSYTVVSR